MTLEELKKETLEAVEIRARHVYEEIKRESWTYSEVGEKAYEFCQELEKEGYDRISREMAERIGDMLNEEVGNIEIR